MATLRFTSSKMVVGTGFKEITIEEFFNTLESNLGLSYNVERIALADFKVIYDSVEYDVDLNEVDFADFTILHSQLKDLSIKSKKFITDAENGITPNNNAKKVYLKYLKNNKKFSFSKTKEYFSNILKDIYDSIDYVDNNIWEKTWPFNIAIDKTAYFLTITLVAVVIFAITAIGGAFICGIRGSVSVKWLYSMLLSLLPFSTYLVPLATFIGIQTKKRYNRLISFIKNRKLVTHEIKQLTHELSKEQISSSVIDSFNKTLPKPIIEQNTSLIDPIMININDIINKLNYINSGDRNILLREVKDILDEYVERLNKINKQSLTEGLQLEQDNHLKLKSEILAKIVAIEQKMLAIRNNDVDRKIIEEQQSILLTKIEDSYVGNDSPQIGIGYYSRIKKPIKPKK